MEHIVEIIHRQVFILHCGIHFGRMMSFYGLGRTGAEGTLCNCTRSQESFSHPLHLCGSPSLDSRRCQKEITPRFTLDTSGGCSSHIDKAQTHYLFSHHIHCHPASWLFNTVLAKVQHLGVGEELAKI